MATTATNNMFPAPPPRSLNSSDVGGGAPVLRRLLLQSQQPQQQMEQQQQSLSFKGKPAASTTATATTKPKQQQQQLRLASMLMVVLLVIASTSLFHSIHLVDTAEEQQQQNSNSVSSLQASLQDFKQNNRRTNNNNFLPQPQQEEQGRASHARLRTTPKRDLELHNKNNNNNNNNNKNIVADDMVDELDKNVRDGLYPRPQPIANPPMPDGNQTFGACLLVMDDNHRLVEWLAYHYHVLPLRYLIVTVDPRSKTSPTSLLNRWRDEGMYILEWHDGMFLKQEMAAHPISDEAELQVKRDRHRIRQKNFYQACLKNARTDNRTWMTLIDTDEFLMYNHKSGGQYPQDDIFDAWEKEQIRLLKQSRFAEKHRYQPSRPPPSPAQAGQLIRYIHQEQAAGIEFFQRACVSCPRLQFGAKESTKEERQKGIPPMMTTPLDAQRLDTLRYRKHAPRQDFVKNGLSKSIMDVSRIDKFPRIQSLHRPIKTECTAPWKDEWDSGLRIYHYLGSWEAYSYRDDSRRGGERSLEGWAFKAQDADDTDDNIRPWISGFIEDFGPTKAQELLQGAGLPPDTSNTINGGKNWTIQFLDIILGENETKGNDVRVSFDNFVRDFHFHRNQSLEGLV